MTGVIETYIKVKWDFIGFHQYDNAPEEVEFLRQRHRHKFYCSATIQVKHDNRELEFFMIQEELIGRCCDSNMNNKSCEMIARDILFYISDKYPERNIEVEVSEDNENSSKVVYKCV